MAKRNTFLLSLGLALAAAFGCSGSSTGSSTSSTGAAGTTSGGTTGSSLPPTAPTFTPAAETSNNDINVIALDKNTNATICFRTDGTTPTCDLSTAACTGGAQTYNGTTQIPVTGAVTNPTTGQVTVEAIACLPGLAPSKPGSAVYILQVAAPTMSAPAGNVTIPFEDAKALDPLISTTTVSTNNDVQIWYTVGAPPAAAPTCSSGAGPIPETGSASSGLVSSAAAGGIQNFITSTTFQVIACKQGYLPSAVTTFAYTIQLNPPGFLAVSSSEDGGFWPTTQKSFDYNATFQIDDSLNAGATDYLCVVVGSGTAVCDPSGDCDAGTMLSPGGTITGSLQIGNADTFSEPISAVACGSADLVDSEAATGGPYSLLLDPVTSNPASGATLPSDGSALPLTLEQSLPNLGDPQPATSPAYDYICWTEDGTSPSCDMDCPQSTGGSIGGVFQGQQHADGTTVQLPSSGAGSLNDSNFPTGAILVAIGCRNSTPPPTIDFGPSPLADVDISP